MKLLGHPRVTVVCMWSRDVPFWVAVVSLPELGLKVGPSQGREARVGLCVLDGLGVRLGLARVSPAQVLGLCGPVGLRLHHSTFALSISLCSFHSRKPS